MRENLELAWAIAYIVLLLVYSAVLFLGLPVALIVGITSGDWSWLLVWAVLAAIAWIADKLGWVQPIND